MLACKESIQSPGRGKPIELRGESDVGDGNAYDEVVSRHLVQETYTRIKSTYANDLCTRWIEKTQPSKHVFQDLMIAAFLIELWRGMYGVTPANEGDAQIQTDANNFPGFVDIACGNGVVVYVLLMEGYQGFGFDARRRKTWSIFPGWVQEKLVEKFLVPRPFADALGDEEVGMDISTGDFPRDAFIISNHADELTVWTPLIAALACPTSPLPFLAIPCCSHSLSGSHYRYPLPKVEEETQGFKENARTPEKRNEVELNPQPAAGDLKTLRAAKNHEKTAEGFLNSMYGSLTAKTISIAAEIGYDVEKTQLQIPSPRNTGVLGGRQSVTNQWKRRPKTATLTSPATDEGNDSGKELSQKILDLVDRECTREGGRQASAQTWVERAPRLHVVHGNRRYPDDTRKLA